MSASGLRRGARRIARPPAGESQTGEYAAACHAVGEGDVAKAVHRRAAHPAVHVIGKARRAEVGRMRTLLEDRPGACRCQRCGAARTSGCPHDPCHPRPRYDRTRASRDRRSCGIGGEPSATASAIRADGRSGLRDTGGQEAEPAQIPVECRSRQVGKRREGGVGRRGKVHVESRNSIRSTPPSSAPSAMRAKTAGVPAAGWVAPSRSLGSMKRPASKKPIIVAGRAASMRVRSSAQASEPELGKPRWLPR